MKHKLRIGNFNNWGSYGFFYLLPTVRIKNKLVEILFLKFRIYIEIYTINNDLPF